MRKCSDLPVVEASVLMFEGSCGTAHNGLVKRGRVRALRNEAFSSESNKSLGRDEARGCTDGRPWFGACHVKQGKRSRAERSGRRECGVFRDRACCCDCAHICSMPAPHGALKCSREVCRSAPRYH